MSIWIYEDTLSRPLEDDVVRDDCIFCHSKLQMLAESVLFGELKSQIRICLTCGWWSKNRRSSGLIVHEDGRYFSMWGACAQLKNLDLVDINTPLTEIKQYLVAKYESRFELHPKLYEDVVGSVFRSQGFYTEVTAYQKDGGIDVVLSSNDKTIGVQVKRYRNKIDVEQIRAFAGALLLGGHTSGIFVATSSYTGVAKETSRAFGAKGIPIELIDAEKFYEALKVSQIDDQTDFEELYYFIDGLEEAVVYENEGPFR